MWDLRSLAASSLAMSFSELSDAGAGGGRVQPILDLVVQGRVHQAAIWGSRWHLLFTS